MAYDNIVREVVEAVVEGEGSVWAERGFFVVEVACKGAAGDDIEVVVDCDGEGQGVGIDDCALLSREISDRLVAVLPHPVVEGVEEEPDFSLTVMSAGLGQPIRLGRQLRKLMKRASAADKLPRVDVLFKSGRKLSGVVLNGVKCGAAGETPTAIEVTYEVKELLPGKKRKETVQKEEQLAWDDLKTVTEYFDFK